MKLISLYRFVRRRKTVINVVFVFFWTLIFLNRSRKEHHLRRDRILSNQPVRELFPYKDMEQEGIPVLNAIRQKSDHQPKQVLEPVRVREKTKYTPAETTTKYILLPPLVGCPSTGVLTIEDNGSIGSIMSQYAVLLSLARRDRKYAFLPDKLHEYLVSMFNDVQLPKLSSVGQCKIDFSKTDVDTYENLRKVNPRRFLTTNFLLKRGPNRAKLYHQYRTEITRMFQVKKERQGKREIVKKLKLDNPQMKVIGIYVEMEDYKLMKKEKKSPSTFLKKSIEHFQLEYSQTVFILRCSSAVWCKSKLKNDVDSLSFSSKPNIEFVGSGEIWNFLDDLAVLTGCDHVIVMRSLFSWWIAYCNLYESYAVFPTHEGSMSGNVRSLHLDWRHF